GWPGCATAAGRARRRRRQEFARCRRRRGKEWRSWPLLALDPVVALPSIKYREPNNKMISMGSLGWWIDGAAQTGLSGLDNAGQAIDQAHLGLISQMGDAFESYIGPAGGPSGHVRLPVIGPGDGYHAAGEICSNTTDDIA